jgi:glutathione peroxidase
MTIKLILICAAAVVLGVAVWWYLAGGERPARKASRASIYDCSFTSIDGRTVPLASFKGKYMLLVNVASQCGFTPQYEELEKLSEKYKDRLVVIGFPANDFMGQEPGTNEEIKTFCTVRYGVTFPLSQKVSVTGAERSVIYRWLTESSLNGWNDKAPKWNFYKYLVAPDGELAQVFPSTTTPLSESLTGAIR